MKFTCLRENLSKNLAIVSKAIPIKHSMPILSNVLISAVDGRLRLAGTNLETAITVYVPAEIEEEGAIAIPAKLFGEFISNLSSETISATLVDDTLHVSSGKTKSKFNGMDASDYPALPEVSEGLPYLELDPKEFSNAVAQVGFSVAVDDTRPVFSGIYITYSDEKLILAASDGFRLSEKTILLKSKTTAFSVILPARTLLEIARILNSCNEKFKFYLNETENLCLFECQTILIASRIIDGTYPDYKRIIPSSTALRVSFNALEFLEAVKLTSVFARDSDNALKMIIDPAGNIKITSSAQETGENHTEISAQIETELENALEIIFNVKYLLDFLTNAKFERFVFNANDRTSPCLIKPVDEDALFLHVMAPMHPTE